MQFELSVTIDRPSTDVFCFLRDKDQYPQEKGSPVLVLEQTTPGPAGVGTRYREVVQMLPGYRGEILSEITRFEPGVALAETFSGAGMSGELLYEFRPEGAGTLLVQIETLRYRGALRLMEPIIRPVLRRRLQSRLGEIKRVLEGGWVVSA